MTKGKIEYAERQALNLLDKWLETSGIVTPHTSYYYELQGIIEDAVHIGIQMALEGKITMDENGVVKQNKVDYSEEHVQQKKHIRGGNL